MVIWLALIIPIITSLVLYSIPQFRKKTAWWETLVKIIIVGIFIMILKMSGESSLTSDTEYMMDYVVKVEHHTYWNEWIVETCSEEYACGTDANGNTQYCTRYYDCSYEETYYPYTKVITKSGKTFTYNEGYKPNGGKKPYKFIELSNKFNDNKKFIKNKKRYINTFYDKRSVPDLDKKFIGNIFYINWKGETNRIEAVNWKHTYENRVQASNSIDNFPEVDTMDINTYGLYNYPKIVGKYDCKSMVGINSKELDEYINQRNSLIAKEKQLKVFFVFFKNKSRKAALLQEQYWKGGNKNEVVVCIGYDDDNNIDWSYVFSWTKVSKLKIEIRNYVLDKGELNDNNFKDIIDYTFDNLQNNFERREFSEFNYLTVEPPKWSIITAFIFSFLLSIGLSIYIIKNEFDL